MIVTEEIRMKELSRVFGKVRMKELYATAPAFVPCSECASDGDGPNAETDEDSSKAANAEPSLHPKAEYGWGTHTSWRDRPKAAARSLASARSPRLPQDLSPKLLKNTTLTKSFTKVTAEQLVKMAPGWEKNWWLAQDAIGAKQRSRSPRQAGAWQRSL